jgi:hypothetical protein
MDDDVTINSASFVSTLDAEQRRTERHWPVERWRRTSSLATPVRATSTP